MTAPTLSLLLSSLALLQETGGPQNPAIWSPSQVLPRGDEEPGVGRARSAEAAGERHSRLYSWR